MRSRVELERDEKESRDATGHGYEGTERSQLGWDCRNAGKDVTLPGLAYDLVMIERDRPKDDEKDLQGEGVRFLKRPVPLKKDPARENRHPPNPDGKAPGGQVTEGFPQNNV